MTLIADVFPKLRIPKNVVRSMSKESRFWGPFKREDGKWAQTLLKLERQHPDHIYWLLQGQLSCKNFVLVIWKILRLFFKTVTADDKCSFLNWENLMQPIQMQLSQKQKTFSGFFARFLKESFNVESFEKKDDPHSSYISRIMDFVKQVKSMSNRCR